MFIQGNIHNIMFVDISLKVSYGAFVWYFGHLTFFIKNCIDSRVLSVHVHVDILVAYGH